MTTIELTKSGIAMKKFRSDPQNALNERRKDVLRYVEKRGSFPIAQNWRKYGFKVAEIVARIRNSMGSFSQFGSFPPFQNQM